MKKWITGAALAAALIVAQGAASVADAQRFLGEGCQITYLTIEFKGDGYEITETVTCSNTNTTCINKYRDSGFHYFSDCTTQWFY